MFTGNTPELPDIELLERSRSVTFRGDIVEDIRQVAIGGYTDHVVDDEDVLTLVGVAEDARLIEGQHLNLPAETAQLVDETAERLLENYDKRKTRRARFLGHICFTAHSAKNVQKRIAPIEQDLTRLAEMPPEEPYVTDESGPQILNEFMVAAEVTNYHPEPGATDSGPIDNYANVITY